MRALLIGSLGLAFVALGSAGARAAQVTEVADAVDGDDPFDAYLELKFDVTRHSGLLTRENTQPPQDDPNGEPRTADVKENEFEHVKFRIRPRLEVGVFHDISVFAEWPIVIWHQQTWRYAEGTNDANSTIARDQFCADGTGTCANPKPSPIVDSWPEQKGAGNTRPQVVDGEFGFPRKPYNQWRLNHEDNGSFLGYRQGFDNPTFGVRFDPSLGQYFGNERHDWAPSFVIQADYTVPFFQFMDPTNDVLDDPQNPGPVADGAHRFHFSVAASKRFLILDPYFVIDYGFGLPASGNSSITEYQPRQIGGFRFGTEIVPYEDTKLNQRFAIDINAFATYFSEGRDYSEISDVFQEQTYTDQWVRTGVNAGFFFRAFEYFFFDVTGTIATDSEHLMTIEDFGTDCDDGNSDDDDGCDNNVEINLDNAAERNPMYNPAIDTVGRRLRVEQVLHLGVLVHAGITF